MTGGSRYLENMTYIDHKAWAVHSGDVSAMPIPSALWLFSSGILGLIYFTKRK